MPSVCVLIPMFGKENYTNNCIDSILKNSGMESFDILVVDDGSEKPFKHESSDVRVIIHRLPENTGFTNAVNEGLLWAGDMYSYILVLNNDTNPYPDFLRVLVEFLDQNQEYGIASSVRVHQNRPPEQHYELYGVDLIRGFQAFCGDDNYPIDPVDCVMVPFCSVLLRVSMLREIGILDKRFHNHSSDTDLCIRAHLAGWKTAVIPESKVLHYLSVTTTFKKAKIKDDQNVMLDKLAGMGYAKLMSKIPLDIESKTYGAFKFEAYQK